MAYSSKNSLNIGTSISYSSRIEVQQKTLSTWLDADFTVLSFSSIDEIATLKNNFPRVTFVAVLRTGAYFVGKPVVFISVILQHLSGLGGGRSEF